MVIEERENEGEDYVPWAARPCTIPLRIEPTLAITWPQVVLGEEDSLVVAAQVDGDVS